MNHRANLARCAVLLIVVAACSEDTGPPLPSKVLVTNTTCATGPCATFEVLAFPGNQPNTPGGLWSFDLGAVTGASACLTIPPSAAFTVNADTVERWTTSSPLSIGLVTPGQSAIQAAPSTGTFVPAHAAVWSVSLPGNAAPVPSADCQ